MCLSIKILLSQKKREHVFPLHCGSRSYLHLCRKITSQLPSFPIHLLYLPESSSPSLIFFAKGSIAVYLLCCITLSQTNPWYRSANKIPKTFPNLMFGEDLHPRIIFALTKVGKKKHFGALYATHER